MINNSSKLFEEIFSEEIISNESFRSKVLAGIVGFLIVVVLLISLTFKEQFKEISQFPIAFQLTIIILSVIFVRSLFVSRGAKQWTRYGVKAFILIRYINAFIEISIPTVALIIYSFNLPSVYPLFTPVALRSEKRDIKNYPGKIYKMPTDDNYFHLKVIPLQQKKITQKCLLSMHFERNLNYYNISYLIK